MAQRRAFWPSAWAVALVIAAAAGPWARAQAPAAAQQETPVVVRLAFGSRQSLDAIAARYDVWEVHHELGYAMVALPLAEYERLIAQGIQVTIDEPRTREIQSLSGIPSTPCYRSVEETYATLHSLAATYPRLTELIDIGDSWDKTIPAGPAGYDLLALRLTNENIPGPKPVFFLMAEIHAREMVTAETATRLAEYLLEWYGADPEITFFLDYHQIDLVPMANPDGRKLAEQGLWWRKNTDSDDGCGDPSYWGTDLNRNHSFKWGCCAGSSSSACDQVYRGPSAGSEPETQAIENYVLSLFADQRGPNDGDAAPLDTSGLFITLHSYSELVLWPWGWTAAAAPNGPQLQAIGKKLASYNGYVAQQSMELYTTDGTSDDWAYGVLGIPSFTFEMGSEFFEPCNSFESTVWPDNRDALLYALKIAGTPYRLAYGPDALGAAAAPSIAPPGTPVQITATIEHWANDGQPIQGAEYFVLPLHSPAPPGDPGSGTAMLPADGSWTSNVEAVSATIDTGGLAPGRYLIALRGQDAGGYWGPFTALGPVWIGTVHRAYLPAVENGR